MRRYQVWLKDASKYVEVQADDVELNDAGNAEYWNFILKIEDADTVTVAAFPFANVDYVLSA